VLTAHPTARQETFSSVFAREMAIPMLSSAPLARPRAVRVSTWWESAAAAREVTTLIVSHVRVAAKKISTYQANAMGQGGPMLSNARAALRIVTLATTCLDLAMEMIEAMLFRA
jgi:hypothetical protein